MISKSVKQTQLEQTAKELLDLMIRKGENSLERLQELLLPEMSGFGTGKDEIVLKFDDYLPFFEREAEQVNDADYELLRMTPKMAGNTGVVEGELNFLIPIDKDIVPVYARFTFVFTRQNGIWKVVSGHMSTPTADQAEGEAFAFNAIKVRNQELEKLVVEKTADLEQKNRELRIEAALERVRARAMAMQNTDELAELVEIVFKELTKLDFSLTRCFIRIFDADASGATLWSANPEIEKTLQSFYIPFLDFPVHQAMIREWKARNPQFLYELQGDEKIAIDKVLLNETELKNQIPEEVKTGLMKPERVLLYFSFSNFGSLEAPSLEPLSDDIGDILYRFAKVFDLTYTRFLDLQKAEAQAREAQIEAALEKVRSRSLAMHKSDELQEVVNSMLERLKELEIELDTANILIFSEGSKDSVCWVANDSQTYSNRFRIPYADITVLRDTIKAKESGQDLLAKSYSVEEKNELFDYFFTHTDFKYIPEDRKKQILESKQYALSIAIVKNVGVQITSYSKPSFSQDENEVLKRFAKVFEQAYVRFLDLQRAEAQAREAQIQLALERVRAKAMAMHHSDEILNVITELKEQLLQLGFQVDTANFNTAYRSKDWDLWMASIDDVKPTRILIPWFDHPIFNDISDAIIRGDDFVAGVLNKEEKDRFLKHLFENTILKDAPEEGKQYRLSQKGFAYSVAFSKITSVTIANYDAVPYSDEQNAILRRLGNAFDQAYTRFLDLQRAEAQAREAQIEAALEKVRSKTMAMHHASEIQSVITEVTAQLVSLGFKLYSANFNVNIDIKQNPDMYIWSSNPQQIQYVAQFRIPYFDHPMFNRSIEAINNGEKFIADTFTRKEKDSFYTYLFEHTDLKNTSEDVKKYVLNTKGLARSVVILKNTALSVLNLDGDPYTEEQNEILKRIGQVFDQAYTRFLDLQKAEAQAREAEIQLGLERVRAKAMAMHNSQDLADTIGVFYKELHSFSLTPIRCGVGLLNKQNRTAELFTWNTTEKGTSLELVGTLKMEGHPVLENVYEGWINQTEYHSVLRGNEIKEYYQILRPQMAFPDYSHDVVQYGYFFFFKEGGVYAWTENEMKEEELNIYRRFTSVLSLTYKRYKDLKQAEEQAREAKIEAALERVRSRTMAMQRSDELAETTSLLFQQFKGLADLPDRVFIATVNEEDRTVDFWATALHGTQMNLTFRGSLDNSVVVLKEYNAAKSQKAATTIEVSGQELRDYLHYLQEAGFPINENEIGPRRFYTVAGFSMGYMGIATPDLPAQTSVQLLERFAGVFDLTYTRFLDLKKAEEQAREARIEAALERIRSRTMAMQRSEELSEVSFVFYRQFKELAGVPEGITIAVMNEEESAFEFWVTGAGGSQMANKFKGAVEEPVMFHKAYNACKEQQKRLVVDIAGEDLLQFREYLKSIDFPVDERTGIDRAVNHCAFFSRGFIAITTLNFLPEETLRLLERFTSVFDLTYTRFLDLQKAEARAREAQIELGLERVRARAMAMQKSEELSELIATVFHELNKLDFALTRCLLWIFNHETSSFNVWAANVEIEKTPESFGGPFAHPYHEKLVNAWRERRQKWIYELKGEEKRSLDDYLLNDTDVSKLPDIVKEGMRAHGAIFNSFSFQNFGGLQADGVEPLSEENLNILYRFSREFDRTYTRFLDLQKAEAQAREAQIEAALERVRARAMAMHDSHDLTSTAGLVFTELRKLGINPIRCGVSLQSKESRKNLLYYAIPSAEGDNLSYAGSALLSGHPVLAAIYDHWTRGEDYFPVLKGESLISYYQTLKGVGFDVPVSPTGHEQHGYYLAFSEGMFYGWSEKPFTESEIKILKRFASVIDLTFRRYMELQKSEANAKEARRQASIDRVRAEIASMRTTDDLDRITPLIWSELTMLGVPFIRCGVFIMDDEKQIVETYLSTPEGKALAAFQLPYDTEGIIPHVLSYWRSKQLYTEHWDAAAFTEWTKSLVEHGVVQGQERYTTDVPPSNLYLHFLPFLQGMLYVGNTAPLQEEEMKLVQSLADAFSTAYARYEDFSKLESAKQQIETTLTELKSTQAQLIQKEKMASLGELTAGVAHEIQNPLNFVNNFSEVSIEMLDEVKQEIIADNKEEAIGIVDEAKENLQKVVHHGKRADTIVKGMLQHSRQSIGQKEPTDINALVDEYLRLAYHGVRAKNKNFNAVLKTDFDPSVQKINVVPQDLGRVLVNLFNNAFYAVQEKKKQLNATYEPAVSVCTKRTGNRIEIAVQDNGTGIPKNIRDKIYQPFFTTKPTGEGTGLGLSLSYDIITKGHGGEIKVDTKQGEGAEFIIQLPAK